jgi:ABC-2 type transport system permease protein
VSVLPDWLQVIAWCLPPTYVFEGMRSVLIDHVFRTDLMLQALAINICLIALGFVAFYAYLRSARTHGTLLQGAD